MIANTFYADLERGKMGEKLVKDTFIALGYEIEDKSKDEEFMIQDVPQTVSNTKSKQTIVSLLLETLLSKTAYIHYAPKSNINHGFGQAKRTIFAL